MKANEIVKRTIQTPGELFVRESAPGEAPSRKICGYAIMFNTPSVVLEKDTDYEEREVIDPKAITQAFLDSNDIIMTMYHDRQKVLARSNKGKGTLSYRIDNKGVFFQPVIIHAQDPSAPKKGQHDTHNSTSHWK